MPIAKYFFCENDLHRCQSQNLSLPILAFRFKVLAFAEGGIGAFAEILVKGAVPISLHFRFQFLA